MRGGDDQEPDPDRRVPTLLWFVLGLLVVAAFAAVVVLWGGGWGPRSVGPPAGSPPGFKLQ